MSSGRAPAALATADRCRCLAARRLRRRRLGVDDRGRRPTTATTATRRRAGDGADAATGDGRRRRRADRDRQTSTRPSTSTQPRGDGDDLYVVEQGGTDPAGRSRRRGDDLPRHLRRDRQRRRAGAALDRLRTRLRRLGPVLRRLHRTPTATRGSSSTRPKDGVVDESSARELLAVDQPYPNHNGGLCCSVPTASSTSASATAAPAATRERRGLDLSTLLGKILRIDPEPDGELALHGPADNPFVGTDGARARDLLLRPPQPVALLLRPRDRRPDDRRRRPGRRGGDRPRRPRGGLGRQLRLVRLRGRPALQRRPGVARRDPAGARRRARRRQLLDHRRPRRPRPGPAVALRPLPLGRPLRRRAAQLHARPGRAGRRRHRARPRRRAHRQLRRGRRRHRLRGLDLGPRLPTATRPVERLR